MNSKRTMILIFISILIIISLSIPIIITNINESKNNNEKMVDKGVKNTHTLDSNNNKKYEVDMRSNLEKQAESLEYYNKSNKANRLEIQANTTEQIIEAYINDYKYNALNFPEDAFETIDEQYRIKHFGNSKNYKKYIDQNLDVIKNTKIIKYAQYDRDKYKEYVCIDNNNYYYIFYIFNPGNYKLILDTYTVDLPEFTEKYQKVNDQEKVLLNINKITTALNAGDYKYVYDKLADSFKNNYFKNHEDFEEYWKNKLYKKFVVQYLDFAQEGNLYTYKIRITKEFEDGEVLPEGKNAPSENLNIVMQLEEGTDFVISFSVLEQ